MTTTTNLGITLIDTNQSQKEVTHNEGIAALDAALTESVSIDMVDGANAVTAAQARGNARLVLAAGTATAAFTVTLPAIKRKLIVTNDTAYDATIACADADIGAAEAIVEAGATAEIYCDAAEVVAVSGAASAGGAVVFVDLVDAPNNYTGSARKHVAVNASETGLEFVDSDAEIGITEQTDSYTLTLGDSNTLVAMNKATALTLTVPPQSSVAWPRGTQIYAMQLGAGQLTIAAGSGVTIQTPASFDTRAQYSEVRLVNIDTDLWALTGDLVGTVGTNSFIGQTDTPAAYAGAAGKFVRVKDDASGVEFSSVASEGLGINAQTGTTYTLALTDAGTLVTCASVGAISVTVPAAASIDFPIGTQILVAQYGAGQVTIVADTGVTIRTSETLKLRKQYAQAALVKIGADEWLIEGNLEASA